MSAHGWKARGDAIDNTAKLYIQSGSHTPCRPRADHPPRLTSLARGRPRAPGARRPQPRPRRAPARWSTCDARSARKSGASRSAANTPVRRPGPARPSELHFSTPPPPGPSLQMSVPGTVSPATGRLPCPHLLNSAHSRRVRRDRPGTDVGPRFRTARAEANAVQGRRGDTWARCCRTSATV